MADITGYLDDWPKRLAERIEADGRCWVVVVRDGEPDEWLPATATIVDEEPRG